MSDYLIIDGSYYCFYRYHALKQWWGFARKDLSPIEHQEEFLEKFRDVFIKKLLELPKTLNLENPTIMVGKDCPRKDIWRMEIFPEYKGNRNSDTDPLLKLCFKMVYQENLFQMGGVQYTIYHPRLEADDVIALHTKHLRETEASAFIHIITSDTDYLQLLGDNIEIYTLNKTLLRDSKSFDGNVEKYLFCKCLMGDKSDNIPSAFPKCGEKTANKCWNNPEYLNKKLFNLGVKEQLNKNKQLIDFNNVPEMYANDYQII